MPEALVSFCNPIDEKKEVAMEYTKQQDGSELGAAQILLAGILEVADKHQLLVGEQTMRVNTLADG